ncbi:hypothetical protein [Streptomyces sp. CB01881]|uniref:hypothetical protein n=1 Tax=Streptomyces sp. CB01881 TaxID=2078691 RepID=UPI00129CD0CB|nr:hypothetical protein [Streptomyces sp. CB01881]
MTGNTPEPSRPPGGRRAAGAAAVLAALAVAGLLWAALHRSGLVPPGHGLARLAGKSGVKAVAVAGAGIVALGYYLGTRHRSGTDTPTEAIPSEAAPPDTAARTPGPAQTPAPHREV